jgi:tetratricopeptide (TPR) repeat protein
LERLEPCEGRLSCTVLRGRGGSNAALLPGDLARRAENEHDECQSLSLQAWAAHLRGELEAAGVAFAQAEALEREIDSTKRYLYSLRGINHANHLRRTGQADYARRVSEANLEICQRNHWSDQASMCHRVLGNLDADPTASSGQAGQHASARQHYDEALKIARGISDRAALIEALLARGCFAARQAATDPKGLENPSGLNDLNEALGYAVASGYRIYEADIRIGLAWAHLALALSPKLAAGQPPSPEIGRGELEAARAEAERARQMSVDMGYHWGQVDADQVLAALN